MSENKTRLKRETQGAFCVLNANAKSQTRKSMKINVICTVVCGDFRQLKPVPNDNYYDAGHYCFSSNAWEAI